MTKPKEGESVTSGQVAAAVNAKSFPNATPDKGWHAGLFEPWAKDFGYADGIPLYGGVLNPNAHIYWLNDGHQAPIILQRNETPANYGVKPK